MSERNPNHPVTRAAHDHWHKIAAIIMAKQGLKEIEITAADVELLDGNTNIVLDERGSSKTGTFKVRLVDNAEACRLAAEEGGLPFDRN